MKMRMNCWIYGIWMVFFGFFGNIHAIFPSERTMLNLCCPISRKDHSLIDVMDCDREKFVNNTEKFTFNWKLPLHISQNNQSIYYKYGECSNIYRSRSFN